jgi:hypothetical protein
MSSGQGALMKCPFCLEKIINGAKVCRFCGKDQPVEDTPSSGPNRTLKFVAVGAAIIAVILLVLVTSNGPTQVAPQAYPSNNQTAQSNATSQTGKWEYSDDKDTMRGTTSRYARLNSENELKFGFPYDGGVARLTIRKRPEDGLNVLLTIKGQFICSSISETTVAIKFDNGRIQHFRCAETTDGSSGTLFIQNEKKFVQQLKKAKQLTIEAEFFREGEKQMLFDVAGLIWK